MCIFIERMEVELEELSIKAVALADFIDNNDIFTTLPKEGQKLMIIQATHMANYALTLSARITTAKGA